jgi:large subunit ribosomal protein L17
MPHNVAHRKLGRVTEHRLALLRNQAEALIRHERIETTIPKAKELRPFVERIITIAKRGVTAGDVNGRALNARRLVLAQIPDKDVVAKLFDTIAPRYAERPGGYTRILRVGFRRGDGAEVAQVELVGSEYNPRAAEEAEAAREAGKPKAKGVGERIKAAAQRMRTPKKDEAGGPGKGQAKGQTRGASRKSTAPRKQGGS